MVFVEVVYVLARDDVDLRILVTIQSVERSKLMLLLDAEIGEIFQDDFHCRYFNVSTFRCFEVSKFRKLPVHAEQELLVGVCLHQSVVNSVHSLDGVHFGNELADDPHAVERGLILQQVVATSKDDVMALAVVEHLHVAFHLA